MKITGIDPGNKGAFVTIDENGNVISKHIMPTLEVKKGKKTKTILDTKALWNIFDEISDSDLVLLEETGAMPDQGVTSMFNFGKSCGIILGFLAAFKIPLHFVHPRTWTKVMHKGLSKEIQSKDRSKIVFQREYPHLDFKRTNRCKHQHDGLIDALLIAEYGRREKL